MPKKRALIVAINEYGSTANNLPSCIPDGEAFERYLQAAHGFSDIRKLFDRDATIQKVEEQLGWLTQSPDAGDTLVFCYSGHGYSKPEGAVVEEYLVLLNDGGEPALWPDDKLVQISRQVPSGVLIGHIDSCFSGGMTKLLFGKDGGEVAKVKAYQPSREELSKAFAPAATAKGLASPRIAGQRKFGRGVKQLRAQPSVAKALDAGARSVEDPSEASQPEFNGTLVLACSEFETAAASTAHTGGLSAFTCKVLEAVNHLPQGSSTRDVLAAAAAGLDAGGFRQTCSAWAPAGSELLDRGFLDPHAPSAKANGAANGAAIDASSEGALGVERLVSALLDALQASGDTQKSLASLLPTAFRVDPFFPTPLYPIAKDPVTNMSTSSNVHSIDAALTERVLRSLLAKHTQNGAQKDLVVTAPSSSAEANQKVVEFLLPIALAFLNGVSTQKKKDFSLDAANTWAADKNLFGDIVRVLGEVAPVLIDTIGGGRNKDLAFGAPDNAEAREKILPLLPLIPIAISVFGALIPKKKDLALDGAASTSAAADKALLDVVGAIARMVEPVVRRISTAAQAA
jgi:hypothetical protein